MITIAKFAAAAALVLGASLLLTGGFARYKSWRSLSPAHVLTATQWYIANRARQANDVTAVCVYVLDCSDDRARLAIVPAPDQYDFRALRQLIWVRRFKGRCQGYTANLGLHILRRPDNDRYAGSDQAIWSFNNDRFIPSSGNWSGGAFSEEPWERCTIDRAAYEVQGSQLVGKGN